MILADARLYDSLLFGSLVSLTRACLHLTHLPGALAKRVPKGRPAAARPSRTLDQYWYKPSAGPIPKGTDASGSDTGKQRRLQDSHPNASRLWEQGHAEGKGEGNTKLPRGGRPQRNTYATTKGMAYEYWCVLQALLWRSWRSCGAPGASYTGAPVARPLRAISGPRIHS